MIKGFATKEATCNYSNRFQLSPSFYIENDNWVLSKLGVGTHLGDFSERSSILYKDSIRTSLLNGINLIDTAVNYRGMISERNIGTVVTDLINKGDLKREEIVISSKAGIIPGDGELMFKPVDYLQEVFLDTGLLQKEDVYMYSTLRLTMNPVYFEHALELSRKHLNLETIDIYYIHLPELSKAVLGKKEFYNRLGDVIKFYEKMVAEGKIKEYGFATWSAFQVDEVEDTYLSIEEVVDFIGGLYPVNHFKHIMLPLNMVDKEANESRVQTYKKERMTAIQAINSAGLKIHTSGSLALGKEFGSNTAEDFLEYLCGTNIDYILVGMKTSNHVQENIDTLNRSKDGK